MREVGPGGVGVVDLGGAGEGASGRVGEVD